MNISISQLSKLISGDECCLFKYWYYLRHKNLTKKEDLSPELVKWRIRHTSLVSKIIEDLKKLGGNLKRERWLIHNLSETDAIVGKADIIHEIENEINLYECKGGKPCSADALQLLIYLYLLSKERYCSDKKIRGILCYEDCKKDYFISDIPEDISGLIEKYSEMLLSLSTPIKSAGSSCRFCEVPCEFKNS